MSAVDALLRARRAGLDRLDPQDAHAASLAGALLVDIRPAAGRAVEGTVPRAVEIERNVVEWRLDPTCPHRIPEVNTAGRRIVLFCDEGYASSLAAAQLRDLGQFRATDIIGGFRAWAAAGLPVLR